MHRHGYTGRKFGRERDQRTALMRGLAVSLVEHGSIETTLPKAKELRPMIEKLVTKARKGDLHARRQIISSLNSASASHKLVEEVAPAMNRTSGYTKIERTTLRRGDNIQLARISFVDPISKQPSDTTAKPATSKKSASNGTSTSAQAQVKRTSTRQATNSQPNATPNSTATVAPKRTGRRGDR
jgi:large subunit ribosomal protein L17